MGRELIQKILLFAENNTGASFNHGQPDIVQLFGVEYDVLDNHLMLVRDEGFVKAQRDSSGWFIEGLTLKGQNQLAPPPSPLESVVEAIREASKQAGVDAREANEISREANKNAVRARIWAAVAVGIAALPFILRALGCAP